MEIIVEPYLTPTSPDVMTLEAFADAHGLVMKITERDPCYARTDMRWVAYFDHAEVKDGVFLTSKYGNGATHEQAMLDYMGQISGQLLVIHAMTDTRREIRVPQLGALR